MRLALRDRGVPLWLDSPMVRLLTDPQGAVSGAVVEREGKPQRIGARFGVILASGGFDHDLAWRKELLPEVEQDWSFGNPAAMGDGIRAGQNVGAATDLLDEAWWFPAIQWPDGRMQFMLNERMMPAQFIVNGAGRRFINEAAPYMDFGHAMIEGQRSGVTHIPCWLITDHRSWNRYVIGGPPPPPEIPGAPGAYGPPHPPGPAALACGEAPPGLRRPPRRPPLPAPPSRPPPSRLGRHPIPAGPAGLRGR